MVAVSTTLTEINEIWLHSPALELSVIFRRNLKFQCDINHRPKRPVPYQREATATSTSTVNRNWIFRTKEVTLLPGVAENEVVRGPRKNDLMGQSFIRSEVRINKCWSCEWINAGVKLRYGLPRKPIRRKAKSGTS